jgi:hypothetical protein
MREYTNSFYKAFPWAKLAMEYRLSGVTSSVVKITTSELTDPIAPKVYSSNTEIRNSTDWNTVTQAQVSNLTGLYHSLDQLEDYFKGIYNTILSRIEESKVRVDEVEAKLKSFRTILSSAGNTIHTIRAGSLDLVEDKSKFYTVYGLLNSDPIEGTFRLADTGVFSSINSLNGFAGKAFIEKALIPAVEEVGKLENITDGSSSTYWFASMYSPSPLRTDSANKTWLGTSYQQGAAILLTYYLERPVIASEIYIDPLITEPLDLVSISWTPTLIQSAITNGSFVSGGVGWTLSSTHSMITSSGIDSSLGALILNTGYISRNLTKSTSYSLSTSSILNSPASAYLSSNRVQLNYYMKSTGLKVGARIVWYNSSSEIINYDEREDFGSNFYNQYTLTSYAPVEATSFDIQLGSFNTPYPPPVIPNLATEMASAMFDNVSVFVGECKWDVNTVIDRPITVSLPQRSTAARYSFTTVQRNPRKKILSLDRANTDTTGVPNTKDIFEGLTESTSDLLKETSYQGSGNSVFSYNFGFRELDIRYREYIPRGAIISKPVRTSKEIRRFWLTVDLSDRYSTGLNFYVYPYADNLDYLVRVNPFSLYSVTDSRGSSYNTAGSIYEVFTNEEINAGYDQRASNVIAVDSTKRADIYPGTDRNGKIALNNPIHFRKVQYNRVIDFLEAYGVHDFLFDPNSTIVYGVQGKSRDILMAYQLNEKITKTLQASDLLSIQGYNPVKVTVRTDKFVAYPDQYGAPTSNIIYPITAEVLKSNSVQTTQTNTKTDFISYKAWLSQTSLQDLYTLGLITPTDNPPWAWDDSIKPDLNMKLAVIIDQARNVNNARIRGWYNSLLANGKIPKDTTGVTIQTTTTKKDTVYKTKFAPLLAGAGGTFLKLYWRDLVKNTDTPIEKTAYLVEPLQGNITLNTSSPNASSLLMADYMFVVKPRSKSVNPFDEESLIRQTTGQDTIITRNMTDYTTGKIPKLRAPVFDPLDVDYYPIIEYYVTPDSEIQFSREFFKYGDQPAIITVEYDTLNIQPRFAVYVVRDSSVTRTPRLKSLGFGYRTGTASPIYNNE